MDKEKKKYISRAEDNVHLPVLYIKELAQLELINDILLLKQVTFFLCTLQSS